MASNNQKFNNFAIVLNAPKEKTTTEQAVAFMQAVTEPLINYNKLKFFASIIHDKDKLPSGELKRVHQHIVIETTEKMTVLGCLTAISSYLDIDKGLLSVEGSNNDILITQYLTHQNQPEKQPYSSDLIKTSNYEDLMTKLTSIYESPSEQLKRAFQAKTIKEFIEILGIEKANQYKGLFKDLKIEEGSNTARWIKRLEDLREFTNHFFMHLLYTMTDTEKDKLKIEDYYNLFKENFLE